MICKISGKKNRYSCKILITKEYEGQITKILQIYWPKPFQKFLNNYGVQFQDITRRKKVKVPFKQ